MWFHWRKKKHRQRNFYIKNYNRTSVDVTWDLCFCFIDCTKAFDRARHEDMSKMLDKFVTDGEDILELLRICTGFKEKSNKSEQ